MDDPVITGQAAATTAPADVMEEVTVEFTAQVDAMEEATADAEVMQEATVDAEVMETQAHEVVEAAATEEVEEEGVWDVEAVAAATRKAEVEVLMEVLSRAKGA